MFEQCRVYDPQGNLKRTHTEEELSRQYWRGFRMDGNKFAVTDNDAKHRKPNHNVRNVQCLVCKQMFETNHPRQTSCGQVCRDKRKKKMNRLQREKHQRRIKEAKALEKNKT